MTAILRFLLLPKEITDFERNYLSRVNRVALVFFALHVPAFGLIAWLNGTGAKTAALLTLAVLVGPALAQSALKNPRWVSVVYGVTAMCMGGLLVHFGQGPVHIEMHFYFFALVAMCAVFGNPMVIVAAACTVAVHHLIVWLVLPQSVFNYSAAWWVVAVHAAFVVPESVATCFISRSFFDNVIGLEKIVQARTDELDGKNREMRLLLDNVQQGFLTIDAAGELARERSAAIDSWFGAPAADASWFDFLDGISPDFAARSRFGWEDVVAAIMPAEVTLAQMPQRLTLRGAHYQIDYRPIGLSEPYAHYLVIVTNVTVEMERERAEVERIESMAIFERVLVDRSGVEIFFEDANQIITALVHQSVTEPAVVKRLIHTLKGNTSIYGLSSLAQLCEQLEDFVAETSALPPRSMYELLEQRWARLASDIEKLRETLPFAGDRRSAIRRTRRGHSRGRIQVEDAASPASIEVGGHGQAPATLRRAGSAYRFAPRQGAAPRVDRRPWSPSRSAPLVGLLERVHPRHPQRGGPRRREQRGASGDGQTGRAAADAAHLRGEGTARRGNLRRWTGRRLGPRGAASERCGPPHDDTR